MTLKEVAIAILATATISGCAAVPGLVCTTNSMDQIIDETKIEEIAEQRCRPLYQVGTTEYLECVDEEISRVSASTTHRYSSTRKCKTVYE